MSYPERPSLDRINLWRDGFRLVPEAVHAHPDGSAAAAAG